MSTDYILRYRREWEELETLVALARKSIRRMTPEQLSRLDVLYRRTTSHLAQVATRTTDHALIQYLNDLTASAHAIIYLPPRQRNLSKLPRFLALGFSQSVVRLWKYHAAAAALMILGAVIAYLSVYQDSSNAYALLIGDESRHPGASREQLLEILRSGREGPDAQKFHFASFLFSHNLKVGILSLAVGALAGIPTVLLILYNGLMLGAFAAIHHQAGLGAEFWAWVLPHGITELGAIALCGGVGLRIGQAVIRPGLYTRSESLRLAGDEAIKTLLGVAVMLLCAAFIESYLRQSHLSQSGRYTFAIGSALFWGIYFACGAFWFRNPRGRATLPTTA